MTVRLIWAFAIVTAAGCAGAPSPVAAPARCPGSVSATLGPEKPTVSVSYTEPAVDPAGDPLRGLAKTTIYYDLGAGRHAAKEVPATTPAGGGQIDQTITVPLPHSRETVVRICVTATDRYGNESQPTP